MPWGISRSNPRPKVRRELHEDRIKFTFTTTEKLPIPSERKQLAYRTRFSESSGRVVSALGTLALNKVDVIIRLRRARREVMLYRNRRPHDLEHPISSRPLGHPTTGIVSNTSLKKCEETVGASVQTGEEECMVGVDEPQTYDISSDLQDISGTPMMDPSVRPPKRIPPTCRVSSHTTKHRRP